MTAPPPRRVRTDVPFLLLLSVIGGLYAVLIVAMLAADVPSWCAASLPAARHGRRAAAPIRRHPRLGRTSAYAIRLSLISCTLTAILSLWVAVPLGYLLSRYRFPGKWLLDALLDIPIVLPPLVSA